MEGGREEVKTENTASSKRKISWRKQPWRDEKRGPGRAAREEKNHGKKAILEMG